MSIEERARETGSSYEYFYVSSYPLLSWYIHSGMVGVQDVSKEGLELVYINSMRLIYESFLDATLLSARELKIDLAIKEFQGIIHNLEQLPGEIALKEIQKYFKKHKDKKEGK